MTRVALGVALAAATLQCGAPPERAPEPAEVPGPPRFDAAAELTWRTYLDRVARRLGPTGVPPGADELVALSDALRQDRDAALAQYGGLPREVVRRSARLIADLEDRRARLEARPGFARAPAPHLPLEPPVDLTEAARALERSGRLLWPVSPVQITSPFGPRRDPISGDRRFHGGLDLAGAPGQPVLAPAAGRVVHAGWRDGRCGVAVTLAHGAGLTTEFCHLRAAWVGAGEAVAAGAPIGGVGSSGRATGPHLHWGVRRHGVAVDPHALAAGPRIAEQETIHVLE